LGHMAAWTGGLETLECVLCTFLGESAYRLTGAETWNTGAYATCMHGSGWGRKREKAGRKEGKGSCSFKAACPFSTNPKP
jgi:hypothetical protein